MEADDRRKDELKKAVDVVRREEKKEVALREIKSGEVLERIAGEAKEPPLDLHLAKPGTFPKGIIWGIVALVLIFVASFGYYLYESTSNRLANSLAKNLGQFKSGVEDLKNLDSQSAGKKFSAVDEDLNLSFGGIMAKLRPLFEGSSELVGGFQNLAGLGASLTREISFFENNLPTSFFEQKGGEILDHLEATQKLLREINDQSDKLSAGASKLGNFSPGAVSEFYLPLKFNITRVQNFLDALIAWLRASPDSPRHLLVMLQNPSEIRPAGGFLGSYADLTIVNAGLANVEVHDINDADRLLDLKIIPPKPLRAEVTHLPAQAGWRAADANWFFDFSQSAAEVIKLMEASKLYSSSSITFDGAIAVSPRILGDLLEFTGPIELSREHLTLDKDNFLIELQKQVQIGQARRATYPKDILKELAAAVIARLENLQGAEKQKLLSLAQEWLAKKDAIFYFKDAELQKSLTNFGLAGRVYEAPANFAGSYLAVVDANVSGGKSDLFIKENVELQSQINADGTVANHLIVDRDHQGDKAKDWWYKTPNVDYLQIFVPPDSELVNFRGGVEKKIYPPVNYARNGYIVDPLVLEIESSTEKVFNYPAVSLHKEDGWQVFSTWSKKISPGEKTEIIFDYSHRLFVAPADSAQYQFIFEKQAGTTRHYKFEISAPVGFKFRENNLPIYEYESDSPPSRLIVNLTLEKI